MANYFFISWLISQAVFPKYVKICVINYVSKTVNDNKSIIASCVQVFKRINLSFSKIQIFMKVFIITTSVFLYKSSNLSLRLCFIQR